MDFGFGGRKILPVHLTQAVKKHPYIHSECIIIRISIPVVNLKLVQILRNESKKKLI